MRSVTWASRRRFTSKKEITDESTQFLRGLLSSARSKLQVGEAKKDIRKHFSFLRDRDVCAAGSSV